MVDQFNILDYTDGPILKTGQTTDFTPAGRTTKDDGGFQRGIEGSKADRQYNILTTGQYAGTTNITVNGFTDVHSNECVQDKVTGLMWSRTPSPDIYGVGTESLFWDNTAGNNEDIFEYCDQANLSNLSGFNDWRLPNKEELESLFIAEIAESLPRVNKIAFLLPQFSDIWSSTTNPNNTDEAVVVGTVRVYDTVSDKILNRADCILCRLGIEM